MKKFFHGGYQIKACIFIAALLLFGLAAGDKKNVWIFVDGKQVTARVPSWRSAAGTVRDAGISMGKHDSYIVSTGDIIEVVRAVPVTLFQNGKAAELWTGEPTVAKVLAKAGISTDGVKVFPSPDIKPIAGMNIVLLKSNEQVVRQEREIPYSTVNRPDSHMELGEQAVVAPGIAGSKDVLVKLIQLANGTVVKEDLTEKILKEPQEKIVALGTTNIVETSRGTMRFKKSFRMEATAYTPWDAGCTGITANGMVARRGLVAVDPSVIALGTRLYIPGYGMAIAADTGGAIEGNRIDLCMESLNDALSFGRRDIKVYVLE